VTAGYRDFEFDLPGALLANLVQILDGIVPVALDASSVAAIPENQGVYQLFLDDKPVYVGKTDADAGLNKRLVRHSRKILHRKMLEPSRVFFKAVRIYVFTAMDLEGDLIRHYGGVAGLPWNGSGFGSNDPGRERDTTKNKPENFDFQFPIDIDRPLDGDLSSGIASLVLRSLQRQVPYKFRVERRALHPDLAAAVVPTLPAPFTTRQAVNHIVAQLPPGWQATKLLGYLIMYKETKAYPQSEVIAQS
jgi:hypothetical protein